MARLPVNSILIAHKAIGLAPRLTGDTRRVAAAIIDHFNHRTGRCDPSGQRLADLLQISLRMVRKAVKELCHGDDRIFDKSAHGGHAHCDRFVPRWDYLHAVVEAWDRRMRTGGKTPPTVNNRAPSRCTTVHSDGEQPCTQTSRKYQSKEPVAVSTSAPPSQPDRQPIGRNGLMKEGRSASVQLPMLLPVAGGKAPTRQDAAEAGRQRKQVDRIQSLPRHERAAAWLRAMGEG